MARPLPERVFDPSKPLVAAKPFTAAGRRFQPGDQFDWRRMSVDQRKVRNMFDVRLVDYVTEKVEEPKAEAPAEKPAPKAATAPKAKATPSKKDSADA